MDVNVNDKLAVVAEGSETGSLSAISLLSACYSVVMPALKDITGQRFGRLLVLDFAGMQPRKNGNEDR